MPSALRMGSLRSGWAGHPLETGWCPQNAGIRFDSAGLRSAWLGNHESGRRSRAVNLNLFQSYA